MMLHRNKTKKVLGFFFLSSFSRRCWAIKWFHFSPVSPYSVCVLIFFFFWLLSSVELHTRLTVYVANTLENVEKGFFVLYMEAETFFGLTVHFFLLCPDRKRNWRRFLLILEEIKINSSGEKLSNDRHGSILSTWLGQHKAISDFSLVSIGEYIDVV